MKRQVNSLHDKGYYIEHHLDIDLSIIMNKLKENIDKKHYREPRIAFSATDRTDNIIYYGVIDLDIENCQVNGISYCSTKDKNIIRI